MRLDQSAGTPAILQPRSLLHCTSEVCSGVTSGKTRIEQIWSAIPQRLEREARQEKELSDAFDALFRPRAPTESTRGNAPELTNTVTKTRERDLVLRSVPCSECGRPLTSAESIDRRMGPVCAERMGCEAARKQRAYRSRIDAVEVSAPMVR